MNDISSIIEWELTQLEIERIIENKDLIAKRILHAIGQMRIDLMNFNFKSKEEMELRIGTLMNLMGGLDKTQVNYKDYIAEINKEKEEQEDERTWEEKQADEEILRIKKEFNI